MAWWRWGKRKEQKYITPDQLKWLFGDQAAKSGKTVTWSTALEAGVAMACARVIAEGIAQVPFKLFREEPSGGRQIASTDPLYDALYRKPNPWQTSFEFREQMGLHLVFAGNFYAYKNRMRDGVVGELLPFEPQTVTVHRAADRTLSYEVRLPGKDPIPVAQEDMWHIRGPSWNGWMGLEGVKLAREAIGLALATEEHASRLFSNGTRLAGILSTDQNLKAEQRKELRESWEETYSGNKNAFKTGIVWGGLKWEPMAMTGIDAQSIEQRRFQVEEVCRTFRVMPIMVGSADKTATYASVEQMMIAHVVHTLGPWYQRIEHSADVSLLTDAQRQKGLYSKFIVNGLMRGAAKDRAEFYSRALGSGGSAAWMTPDEVRGLEDMNPIDGGDVLPQPGPVQATPPAAP